MNLWSSSFSQRQLKEITQHHLGEKLGLTTLKEIIHFEELLDGGSDRLFYRLHYQLPSKKNSLILVHYHHQKAENDYYAIQAEFLHREGLQVPKILHHLFEEGLLWIEDLGQDNLWQHRHDPWEFKHSLYRESLAQIALFHQIPVQKALTANIPLSPSFDQQLYQWEQTYFTTNLLGKFFGYSLKDQETFLHSQELQKLTAQLCHLPTQLIHRDFHSQNIMIHRDTAYLIDFQGMRLGTGLYDVASLLWDPYASLGLSERLTLFSDYQKSVLQFAPSSPLLQLENLHHFLYLAAIERLLQALGAYSYLGLEVEKKEYLHYIPSALANLREVLTLLPEKEFPQLRQILDQQS